MFFYVKGETSRKTISNYFVNEQFDIENGDGVLAGFDALRQLENEKNPKFPTPVLILLTGHSITAPPNSKIIVTQKPLRKSEFVPLLESNALKLIERGVCVEDTKGGDKSKIINGHGCQIFVRESK